MKCTTGREDRFHPEQHGADQRGPFERDRDRILYCTAFRRLAGVTQVVGVAEGHRFHNRLTHTLKVAQIARRLTEHLCKQQPELCQALSIHPEVVEAVALAHDIGHPPFGHVGEEELCRMVDDLWEGPERSGFEGNAQSFRIINKLSLRHTAHLGLNLTRATLGALLKYPWFRSQDETSWKHKKWSAYETEAEELTFARKYYDGEQKSAEAEIMDWADDIAYAVYDLEDFWRVGIIPLGTIIRSDKNLEKFLKGTTPLWWDGEGAPTQQDFEQWEERMQQLLEHVPLEMHEPYTATHAQRAATRNWASKMVGRYVRLEAPITLHEPTTEDPRFVRIEPRAQQEITFLKALTRHYVFEDPALAAQQRGHRLVVRHLFTELFEIVSSGETGAIPSRWRDDLKTAHDHNDKVRLVADMVAGMTEQEAMDMYRRLYGIDAGSVLDPIIQ
jgi:dGTPase